MEEYAVLNVPGFKVVRGNNTDGWERLHTGERATTPYVNPHRWYLGIKDYEVAEYISLKSKINHWKGRKNHRDFSQEKFDAYNKSFEWLLNAYDENQIITKLSKNRNLDRFLPKTIKDLFIF